MFNLIWFSSCDDHFHSVSFSVHVIKLASVSRLVMEPEGANWQYRNISTYVQWANVFQNKICKTQNSSSCDINKVPLRV